MPWLYQLDLIDVLLNFDDIIWFKSRQLGLTWLLGSYASWKVRFGDSVKGMLSSQGEKEAKAFLAKSKYVHDNLPEWMRFNYKHPDSQEIIDFKENDSVLEILPSTSKAGRSTDATFVIRDELATHQNAKENFAAIAPTTDRGGQMIDLSTIDQLDAESHFSERVDRALKGAHRRDLPSGLNVFYGGESGAVLVFGGAELRPLEDGRTFEEWYEDQARRYTAQQLRQEHPRTIEEARDLPEQSRYYDLEALNDMLYQVMPPVHTEVNTRNGMIEIYKPSLVGETYCLWNDPSDGSEDPFHIVVMNTRTGEGVCEATGLLRAEEVASVHDELVRYYNNAFNTFEINAQGGGSVSTTLKNLKTPKQAPRYKPEGGIIPDRDGQYMTEPLKLKILEGLEIPIRKRLIISHRRETIEQLKNLVRIAGEKMPRVPKGRHDDAIMAWAGVWWLQKYMPVGTVHIKSFRYKERWN